MYAIIAVLVVIVAVLTYTTVGLWFGRRQLLNRQFTVLVDRVAWGDATRGRIHIMPEDVNPYDYVDGDTSTFATFKVEDVIEGIASK